MAKRSEQSVRDAVKDCLQRCSRGETPLGAVADVVAKLRAEGWEAEDVRNVEQTVLRVLSGVMRPDDEPDVLPEAS